MGMHIALARWMGAAQYGVYLFALAVITLLTGLAVAGQDSASIRFVSEYRAKGELDSLRGYLHFSRRRVILLSILTAAIASMMSQLIWRHSEGQTALLFGLALLPLNALVQLNSGALKGAQRMLAAFAPALLLPVTIGTVAAGVLFYSQHQLSAAEGILCVVGTSVLVAFVQHIQLGRIIPLDGPTNTNAAHWERVGLRLMLVSAFVVILTQTDIIMLRTFRTSAEVGTYGAALRLAMIAMFGRTAVSGMAGPMLVTEHAAGNTAGIQRVAHYSSRLSTAFSMAVLAILLAYGEPILNLFGHQFADAYVPMLVLTSGITAGSTMGSVGALVNLTGWEKASARSYAVALGTNITLNFILIPHFGMLGAAAATAVSTVLLSLQLALIAHYKLGIRAFFA